MNHDSHELTSEWTLGPRQIGERGKEALVDANALEEHVGRQVLVVAGIGVRRIGETPTTGTPASRRYRPSVHAGNTSGSNGAYNQIRHITKL